MAIGGSHHVVFWDPHHAPVHDARALGPGGQW